MSGVFQLATSPVSLSSATDFLDHLADLSLAEWVDIGRELAERGDTLRPRATACAIVDASIAHHGLGVAAWNVRDAVETIAFLKRQCLPKLSRSERRLLAAAHAAAEDAALAVLAREHLPAYDCTVLCALFIEADSAARRQFDDA